MAAQRSGAQLLHLDAYRLEGPKAMDALLLEDFIETPWTLAIEWPENLGNQSEWLTGAWWMELAMDGNDAAHRIKLTQPAA